MISNEYGDYTSASEWLSALKQDESWLSQLRKLQNSTPADIKTHQEDALRRIGMGETFEFWGIYDHRTEPVVMEMWTSSLTLSRLKIQTIGMLSMEWLENHIADSQTVLTGKMASEQAVKYWKRLIQQKFVDQHFMLHDSTTRQQAMYIAELFAEKLALKAKWKTFEDFWGINNLAQEKNKSIETGKLPSRSNDIDKIFED